MSDESGLADKVLLVLDSRRISKRMKHLIIEALLEIHLVRCCAKSIGFANESPIGKGTTFTFKIKDGKK